MIASSEYCLSGTKGALNMNFMLSAPLLLVISEGSYKTSSWRDLPSQHPLPRTCWRRVRDWEEPFAALTCGDGAHALCAV